MTAAHQIELLAPARDLACGLAAINHGADAVYIGGPHFGARAAARNSLADIEKLIRHGHLFGVRLYITLNTLFEDCELDSVVRLIYRLHDMGVDGIIIQDMGLLECDLPPIPLHASTQQNNRTAEKVSFLEKVGFQQVVLARELSLEDIASIRKASTIALEFFVHGALCVSYSGQCYISELVAGRSANRGECAQFCRHKFTLRDGRGRVIAKDRHLLSLKDLDLSAHLSSLIAAGISSFKIEGRLKDENYVKNITAYYRSALDRIMGGKPSLQRSSDGHCSFSFIPDPTGSFNRGGTDYFLVNRSNDVATLDSTQSIGRRLGRVQRIDRVEGSFILDTVETIRNGDGLCYYKSGGGLCGIKVNRVEGRKIFPRSLPNIDLKTIVYRNFDTGFAKKLSGSHDCRFISVAMFLSETDRGLQLKLKMKTGYVPPRNWRRKGRWPQGRIWPVALPKNSCKNAVALFFMWMKSSLRSAVMSFSQRRSLTV